MNTEEKTVFAIITASFIGVVLLVSFLVALGVGWVMCVWKFLDSDFEPSYKREVIYGVGVVTGLGCVVGYMDFPDTPKK